MDDIEERCKACGYLPSETGATHADNAHDNLCCGESPCGDPGECVTHDSDLYMCRFPDVEARQRIEAGR